jgi:hypothetical protein
VLRNQLKYSALTLRDKNSPDGLHLFDIFGGMPNANPNLDRYLMGSPSDISF